jgi:hypothetical protein
MQTSTRRKRPGVIRPDVVYTKGEICETLSLGRTGWQELLDRGLRVCYVAKGAIVFGSDLLAVLSQYRDEPTPNHRRRDRKFSAHRKGRSRTSAGMQ